MAWYNSLWNWLKNSQNSGSPIMGLVTGGLGGLSSNIQGNRDREIEQRRINEEQRWHDLQQRLGLDTLGLNRELGLGELELGQNRLGLDRELGLGELGLGQDRLGLDRDRLGFDQQSFAQRLAQQQAETGLTASQMDPLAQQGARARWALVSELLGNARPVSIQGIPQDIQSSVANVSGGMRIPEGGFSPQTLAFLSNPARQAAENAFGSNVQQAAPNFQMPNLASVGYGSGSSEPATNFPNPKQLAAPNSNRPPSAYNASPLNPSETIADALDEYRQRQRRRPRPGSGGGPIGGIPTLT